MGDAVHALPVAHALKETYPKAHLTWVVEPIAEGIVRMCPAVDEIIVLPKKELRTWAGLRRHFLPLRRLLRRRRYDASIDLQGLFKSAAVAFLVRADQKIGIGVMRELAWLISRRIPSAHREGHVVEQNLDVVRALGCRVDAVRFPVTIPEEAARSVHEKRYARCGRGAYAALIIGASWANKRWPTAYFAELAHRLRTCGLTPIMVGGGAVDAARAEGIAAAAAEEVPSLVNATSFPELAALLRDARIVIGGDTGPTHLSDALGTPTLMLMGCLPAARNGLYHAPQNVLVVERPCAPCGKRVCALGLDCLDDIAPARVMAAVTRLMAETVQERTAGVGDS